MPDLICDGPITKDHVEQILQQCFKTSNKLITAKGVVISKGLGFTSDVMRVELEWQVKDGLPTRVIVKAPKIENVTSLMKAFGNEDGDQAAADISAQFVPLIHKTECKAYELLLADKPLPIPLIYGFWLVGETNPGVIIMEDLGERSGIIDNIATGLSLNQWRSIVECLADLHGWSLTTAIPWREQVNDMTALTEMFKTMTKTAQFAIKMTKEKYPEYFSMLDEERIAKAMDYDNLMAKQMMYKDVMPDVLQHGDTWINNIMFEKNADGTIGDKVAAFIDWQISFRGCAINDMARLVSMCVNHEVRRANEKRMLQIYYDRLKSKADDKFNTTFDQMEHLYKELMALNGLMCSFMADFMLQNIAKTDEDESGWRHKEMLSRMAENYKDSAKFYGWPLNQEKSHDEIPLQ